MAAHELTWDKRSEIGGRSWACDLGKNGWDRDQRGTLSPHTLLAGSFRAGKEAVILPWAVPSGQWKLKFQWQREKDML